MDDTAFKAAWILLVIAIIFLIILVLVESGFAQVNAPSPDNLRVPPATEISIQGPPVTPPPAIWSLGGENPSALGNFWIMRNGVNVGGASGNQIALCKGDIYVFGRSRIWYRYFNNAWEFAPDRLVIPCPTPSADATFRLKWDWVAAAGMVVPTYFTIHREGIAILDVPYPEQSYFDLYPVPAGTKVCYQVTAKNAAGAVSAKSNEACKVAP